MVKQADPAQRADIFVSVVGVLDSEMRDTTRFIRELHEVLSTRYANYEIVLVDNGAQPSELVNVRAILDTVPCVRVLRLARRHTTDTAIFAGLEAAIGDCVVVLSPVFDPVEVIPQVVALNVQGNDIVQGISTEPLGGSWVGRAGRSLFYWYNRKYLGVEIPDRATYLTGMTRRGVNSLTRSTRNHRYLRHLLRHVGFHLVEIEYTPRMGSAKRRSVKAGAVEAAEMISSYSTHPLRVVTVVGVVAALLNLLYAVYVVIVNLVQAEIAPGWTTTSLQLSLMFFLICSILAVQAEYLGRILTESRREASYSVMEELESTTLISDAQRRNVSG